MTEVNVVAQAVQVDVLPYQASTVDVTPSTATAEVSVGVPGSEGPTGPQGPPGSLHRVTTAASTPTLTVDLTGHDMAVLTAQSGPLTVAAPTGSPINGQGLLYRIRDDGTPSPLTWDGVFRSFGASLPTTTTPGRTLYVGALFNTADSRWDVIAVGQEAGAG